MGVTFKKIEVSNPRDVGKLITDNVDDIEPGLSIIDSCVLLGHARIDLVGLDSHDSLVLFALGFSGNDEMLLRMVDAYSWCLEYPDAIGRLYPKARTESGRPPRVVFVGEALPEAFLRKLKYFNFAEIDCLRFLPLEVNGTTAVYFEPVERLRQTPAGRGVADESPDTPTTPFVQHDFIEGTLPVAGVLPSPGTGLPDSSRTEEGKDEWRDFLKQLHTEAVADVSAEAPDDGFVPEAIGIAPPNTGIRTTGSGALSTGGSESDAEEWQEFPKRLSAEAPSEGVSELVDTPLPQPKGTDESLPVEAHLGDPDTPDSEALCQEWREFLGQLKTQQ